MYVIKMEGDKTLVTTIAAKIYQNDNLADSLLFLVPERYGELALADCAVSLQYKAPDGAGHVETLRILPEQYKGHHQYRVKLDSKLTQYAGFVELWLVFVETLSGAIFQTSRTVIEVIETEDITDSFQESDVRQLDAITIELARLQREKADNIALVGESPGHIRLLADGVEIGDTVEVGVYAGDCGCSSTIISRDEPSNQLEGDFWLKTIEET